MSSLDVPMENAESGLKRPPHVRMLLNLVPLNPCAYIAVRYAAFASQLNPDAVAAFMNNFIYTSLVKEEDVIKKFEVSQQTLEKKVVTYARNFEIYATPRELQQKNDNVCGLLRGIIPFVYGMDTISEDLARSVAEAAVNAWIDEFGEKDSDSPPVLSQGLMQQLKLAFSETQYHGNAHEKFADYLWRCWEVYDSEIFRALYVTVVQSSGFGKSRMLFELALKANDQGSQIKVLYTCARLHESTGYPEATKNLRYWLIPESSSVEQVTSRLEAIYNYAVKNWEEVQREWIKLFNEKESDESVRNNLFQQAENDKKVKKKNIDDSSVKKKQDGKMVVLVVDEARSLLNEKADPGALTVKVNDFRLFRRALALVNDRIGAEGCIFAVLVDTNSKISDLTPSLASDPSSRNYKNSTGLETFPPFVLTHTMDEHWHQYLKRSGGGQLENLSEEAKLRMEIQTYKAIVTGSENDAWNALLRMGPPNVVEHFHRSKWKATSFFW